MRRPAICLLGLIITLSACTASERTAESLALADVLTEITVDTNNALGAFRNLLDQEYDNREQLYQRTNDLRLPTTFAINFDRAQRVEAPPGSEAELERYLDFLGELLLASEQLDAAIAGEDPIGFVIAAVSMEVSSGALAVAVSAESCEQLTPGPAEDLCDPGGLDGYEQELSQTMRGFVASFRPAFRIPDTFGDVVRGRTLGTLQADAARVLEAAGDRLEALEPPSTHERLHSTLLDYFPAAIEAWARHDADFDATDPLVYAAIVSSLEDVRSATAEELENEYELVVSVQSDSRVQEVLDIWFDAPPTP